jgi:hypothetical protein
LLYKASNSLTFATVCLLALSLALPNYWP